jgi:sec-independent protein translocase protein TatB
MFGDIGWAELLLIGIVALIVIGPEDLPQMFRQLGRFTAKMRGMSRDFSRAMEQAAKESGVKDVADGIKGATSATSLGLNKVKAAADRFEKWDPIKSTSSPAAAVAAAPSAAQAAAKAAVASANESAVVQPTIHGPETEALLKKQAAKKAVLMQASEKIKEIQTGAVETASQPAKRTPRTVAAETGSVPPANPTATKPRAARKPKKADEA